MRVILLHFKFAIDQVIVKTFIGKSKENVVFYINKTPYQISIIENSHLMRLIIWAGGFSKIYENLLDKFALSVFHRF